MPERKPQRELNDAVTRIGGALRACCWRCNPWLTFVLTASTAVALAAAGLAAQDNAEGQAANAAPVQVINRESQFKAAFLFNFGHYVAWPDDDATPAETPFVIGVVGGHDAVPHLQRIVAARKRKGGKAGVERSVELRQFEAPAKIAPVHILFIPRTVGAAEVKAIAAALAGQSTLLVGEDDSFVGNGGMINLGVKDGKMYLSVALPALSNAHLKPSAALMRLTPDVRK